jgi:lysophospholipase L1-like esterase
MPHILPIYDKSDQDALHVGRNGWPVGSGATLMTDEPYRVRRFLPARTAGALTAALLLCGASLTFSAEADAARSWVPSLASSSASNPTSTPARNWVGAWTSGQQALIGTTFTDQTLRLLVHPTVGGSKVRIRLANSFGATDQIFDAVSVGMAKSASAPDLVPGTTRIVRFGGAPSVTVASGARAISDPVDLPVAFGQTLAVDLHVSSSGSGPVTGHASAGQGSFVAPGGHSGETDGAAFTGQLSSWYWLDGVDVMAAEAVRGSVVALGDSITDGAYASYNANRRWPDALASRLQAQPTNRRLGILNEGIGGNRVLAYRGDCCGTSESALARWSRDVLGQTGVRTVIIADGINDLGYNASAQDLIQGLYQLAVQAQAAHLRVVAATITPYGCASGCFTVQQEANRQAVNAWIRDSGVFDAVTDFDKAVADPSRPSQLLAAYDAGDHLHLNDSGYAVLAGTVDLRAL